MKGKDLLKCMEFIDDALVEEALNPPVPVRKADMKYIVRWGMAAACVIVMGTSAMALLTNRSFKNDATSIAPEMAMEAAPAGGAEPENAMPQEAAADTAGAMTNDKTDALDGDDAGDNAAEPSYKIISEYYGEKYAEIDYKAPEKGEVIRFHYLDETIRYYTEQENTIETVDNSVYAYEIVIELFGDVLDDDVGMHYGVLMSGDSDEAEERIKQEYDRLVDLGYAVKLSEDFKLTGIFTKVEMDTFQASPEYGYVFRLAGE